MQTAYQPQKREGEIYNLWEKGKYFTPKIERSKKPFVIIMPPPNANGILHVGHAVFVTLEDILETLLGMEIVDEADKAVDMQVLARRNWERRARRLGLVDGKDKDTGSGAPPTASAD